MVEKRSDDRRSGIPIPFEYMTIYKHHLVFLCTGLIFKWVDLVHGTEHRPTILNPNYKKFDIQMIGIQIPTIFLKTLLSCEVTVTLYHGRFRCLLVARKRVNLVIRVHSTTVGI